MFIILLKFSDNKDQASQYMAAHKAWIKQGFDDGIFIAVGSIKPNTGGCVIAHNTSFTDIENKVSEDPFVEKNIVSAEIMDISLARVEDRLGFLVD